MAPQTCRHRACTCAARGDGFCSDYCAGREPGAGEEGHLCACGHDACEAPTKGESWAAVGELAPEGRFVKEERPRDW